MIDTIDSPAEQLSMRRLFPAASFVGCADIGVSRTTDRSSECEPGMLFAALPGIRTDGRHHVGEAIERGASALLVARPIASCSRPQCVVMDVRRAYAKLCATLWGDPATRLRIAGVTGTNGKTTVTWLIRAILRHSGRRVGLLGTVEYHDGTNSQPAPLTTPGSQEFVRWLHAMTRNKATHAAVELSSHALHQSRTAGSPLDAVVVTNVTQDHFDYHANAESYLDAKAQVLGCCKPGALVCLNVDDPGSISLRSRVRAGTRLTTFGADADYSARILRESARGTQFQIKNVGGTSHVSTPLIGRHNVSNCLAAAAVCCEFGLSLDEVAAGIESLAGVPGRLERIETADGFDVFVDYAHTDDALSRSIAHLQSVTRGRVICVFGAGGDRDTTKRPLMARAAATADVVIVTSDNPRTEDPEAIIEQILAGLPDRGAAPHAIVDRRLAIEHALGEARDGDCVLVAGKGHETYQIIGTQAVPFDDREVVRELSSSLTRREKTPA